MNNNSNQDYQISIVKYYISALTSQQQLTRNLGFLTLLMFLSLMLTACGGGGGSDQNEDPPADTPLADNLASIQDNIFTPNCSISGCHSGGDPAEGLSLVAGDSFQNIFNRPSRKVPALKLIEPGDATNSYLIQKVEGTASVGLQMPLKSAVLSVEKMQVLRDWVNDGALGPTLSSIQDNIFTMSCAISGCHSGNNPTGGMNLEAGQAFDNLVGVQRDSQPEIRVVAGDADTSFIIDKLENNQLGGIRGDRMPQGGPFLAQEVIDVIREWINSGAKDN